MFFVSVSIAAIMLSKLIHKHIDFSVFILTIFSFVPAYWAGYYRCRDIYIAMGEIKESL